MLRFMALMNRRNGVNSFLKSRVLLEDLDYLVDTFSKKDELKNSTVLITGATGLIGVSITRAFLYMNEKYETKIQVVALVRNLDKAKLIYEDLLDRTDLSLIVSDVTEQFAVSNKIDYIIHCASVTASKMMIEKPVETIFTAIEGTRNLLDLAVKNKVKSFLYVSSMEMYGSFVNGAEDITEKKLGYIDPLKVRSNYPESKRLCENMCVAYNSEYSVPIKIARLAQTFGAGILPGENRVFAQFARSVIDNKDIVLHTLGKSEGNYCYISDAVLGLMDILVSGENGEAYNIVNPATHTTISDMAKMVCDKIAGGSINVIYDIPEDNQYGYAADTKLKLNSDKLCNLGWKPRIDLETSYRRLIEYIKETEC